MKKLGLTILALIILMGVSVVAGNTQPVPKATPVETVKSEEVEAYKPSEVSDVSIPTMLSLVNGERAKVGLPALSLSPELQQSATAKCADMVSKNYYAHTGPDGTEWVVFLQQYVKAYGGAAENLAAYYQDLTSEKVVSDWMQSGSHRTSIINPIYTHVNFAVCKDTDPKYDIPTVYIVQHFIKEYIPPAPQTYRPLPNIPKSTYCHTNYNDYNNSASTTCY